MEIKLFSDKEKLKYLTNRPTSEKTEESPAGRRKIIPDEIKDIQEGMKSNRKYQMCVKLKLICCLYRIYQKINKSS